MEKITFTDFVLKNESTFGLVLRGQLKVAPYQRQASKTHTNPIKGQGKRGQFWEVIEKIRQGLEELKENPQEIVSDQEPL